MGTQPSALAQPSSRRSSAIACRACERGAEPAPWLLREAGSRRIDVQGAMQLAVVPDISASGILERMGHDPGIAAWVTGASHGLVEPSPPSTGYRVKRVLAEQPGQRGGAI